MMCFVVKYQELELKCKKFAAKFKVKEREVFTLEAKLRVAKDNEAKNVNEEDLIDSSKRCDELAKRVEELQLTAQSLDAALQSERLRRRELEAEKQQFWGQESAGRASSMSSTDGADGSTSFSLLIDEGMGDKSGLHSAKRFLTKQKHNLLRGPPSVRYRRWAIVVYLVIFHVLLLKLCLF